MVLQNSSFRLLNEFTHVLSKTLVRGIADASPKVKIPPQCVKPDTVYDSCPDWRDRGIHVVDPCDETPALKQPRVVIIGAGLAGLSAAARLTDHGITNYVILEAFGRPGGRILSSWLADAPIEIGASWGKDDWYSHPVFKIQNSDNSSMSSTNPLCALFNSYDTDKANFPATLIAYKKFKQIEEEATSIFRNGGSKQHGSIRNFFSIRIQQELHEISEEYQHHAAKVMFGLCHRLASRSPIDTSMLACDASGCYMKLPGGNVRVPLGTISILAPILRKIYPGTLKYCKPVNCIYWGTNQKCGYRAVVRTTDGEEYYADYVIVTISVTCLWAYSQVMFCPALPATKVNSACCLGHGHLNKIFLEYGQPFWYWQSKNLNLKFSSTQLCHRMDWTRGIKSIRTVPNSKYVLSATVMGESARHVECCCDRDIVESLTDLLQSVTGANIPYPVSIVRSRWSSDPFFLCAYPYDIEQSDCGHHETLASPLPRTNEPVPPILLFAGDATVPTYTGTLQAARVSGIREAERIVNLTLQFQGPPVRDRPPYMPANRNYRHAVCPRWECNPCPCPCDPDQVPPPIPPPV